MIVMRPIAEQMVLDTINQGRFEGELEGYVVMDEALYMGHMLYRVQGEITTVLACSLVNTALVDGGVRACIAAGENAGATSFALNMEDAALEKWHNVFFKNQPLPIQNEKLFGQCK